MPREGQLEVVLHVFSFLCQKYNSRMVFDLIYPTINMNDFREYIWKEFYGKLKEASPPNYPEERGNKYELRGYFDSKHSRENKTRRSRSWFFVFLNTLLIQWFSKS